MVAAARCFEDACLYMLAARDQVPARARAIGKAEIRRLCVALPHLAGHKITQQFRPRVFRVTHYKSVRMCGRIVGYKRYVGTAHDDRNAAIAKMSRKFVRALGSACNDSDADEVDIEILGNILDAFVEQ